MNINGKSMAAKYNILFLMNGAKPPRGGEFLTLYLITHLNKDIFNPIVAYMEEGYIVKEIKKTGIETVWVPLGRDLTKIYLREKKLYNPIFISILLSRLVLSNPVIKVKKLIRGKNIDLIYCADNLSKLVGGVAGKLSNVNVIAHCHDDFKEDSLGKVMRAVYLLLLDRILAVSEKVKKFFSDNGRASTKVITVYNGIDADVFNPGKVDEGIRMELGLGKNTIVIGIVGSVDNNKGQRYLIDAVSEMKAQGLSAVNVIICGKGPEEENLKNYVRSKGLTNEVLFLGYRRDIPRVMKILDVLVIASVTIEACPLTAIEAMSMQLPVIATNIGGLPELIDDGKSGILVPPGDVQALSNAIKYLIENPDGRLKMGRLGRQRVLDKFTIEGNVRKTEEIFLEMLETQWKKSSKSLLHKSVSNG